MSRNGLLSKSQTKNRWENGFLASFAAMSYKATHALAIHGSGLCFDRQERLTTGIGRNGSRHNKSLNATPRLVVNQPPGTAITVVLDRILGAR